MSDIVKTLSSLLQRLKTVFDEEGWYCVISDKYNFNQNPDMQTDFNTGFSYRDVRALSIIDVENRIVLNAYFYIIDDQTFYLQGDRNLSGIPMVYSKDNYDFSILLRDVKKVINYY